jgi:hypothetical protein
MIGIEMIETQEDMIADLIPIQGTNEMPETRGMLRRGIPEIRSEMTQGMKGELLGIEMTGEAPTDVETLGEELPSKFQLNDNYCCALFMYTPSRFELN